MELPIVLHESRQASFTHLPDESSRIPLDGEFFLRAVDLRGRAAIILSMALLLFPLGSLRAMAQQEPVQDWPPDDTNSGQYAPAPQPGYGQTPYPQPQYRQPQYAPGTGYGYGQPQYGQPRYTPSPQYGNGQEFAGNQGYPQQPYQDANQPYQQQGFAEGQPLSADELEQMLAPIALYPDTLVAQILAASTYPAQVAAADQWLRAMGNAPPEQIAGGASAQTSWDPSIKALTAFPQVLAMLDRNLQWTTNLGNAYYNQPQDVLQTIQVMRERAESAGNLQSTPQAEVSNNQGYIDIAPPNPQTVYVPSYNPWEVYGQPVQPYPGFSLMDAVGAIGSFLGSSPVRYGAGIAMSAFMGTPFGLLGWGIDWLAHAILFNHGDYFTHSGSVADWGFPRGGPRAYYGRSEWSHGGDRSGWAHEGGYNGSYGRGGFSRPTGGPIARFGGDARTAEGFNRGYPSRENIYGRPALPPGGYSRFSQPNRGTEQIARQGYGSGYGSDPYGRGGSYGKGEGMFGGRSGPSYGAPSRSYGSPGTNYQRGGFGGRGFDGSQSYTGKSQHSSGFHLFGGGHQSNGFGGGGSFGGGHSAWGGSGGFKAPKASHFGGGGGHFGGGRHSGGGGHGGGRHGGGHGGGHHH